MSKPPVRLLTMSVSPSLNTKPSTATLTTASSVRGNTSLSGSKNHFRSYTLRATKPVSNTNHTPKSNRPWPVKACGHNAEDKTNNKAVTTSTVGSSQPIGSLQYRHLPRSNAQLSSGTRSLAASSCLQLAHIDLPLLMD